MYHLRMYYGLGLPQRFVTEDIDISVIAPVLRQAEDLGIQSVWVREQAANARYDLAPIPSSPTPPPSRRTSNSALLSSSASCVTP